MQDIEIVWDKRVLLSDPPRKSWEFRLPIKGEGDLIVMVQENIPKRVGDGHWSDYATGRVVISYPGGEINAERLHDTFASALKFAISDVIAVLQWHVERDEERVAFAESELAAAKRIRDEWRNRLELWKRVKT